MSTPTETAIAAVEKARASLVAMVNAACDDLLNQLAPSNPPAGQSVVYKMPTIADGHDVQNKNGQNLTPRGVEILYRVFDDGGGYNRAGKMLNITQAAAKNRKAGWIKAGGVNRTKMLIDIDQS